jgi:hypothetical protein
MEIIRAKRIRDKKLWMVISEEQIFEPNKLIKETLRIF